MINIAMARSCQERWEAPLSSLTEEEVERDDLLGHSPRGAGTWPTPEERLLAGEAREVILSAVEHLPPTQRAVITLRDMEGCPEEACALLSTSTPQGRRDRPGRVCEDRRVPGCARLVLAVLQRLGFRSAGRWHRATGLRERRGAVVGLTTTDPAGRTLAWRFNRADRVLTVRLSAARTTLTVPRPGRD